MYWHEFQNICSACAPVSNSSFYLCTTHRVESKHLPTRIHDCLTKCNRVDDVCWLHFIVYLQSASARLRTGRRMITMTAMMIPFWTELEQVRWKSRAIFKSWFCNLISLLRWCMKCTCHWRWSWVLLGTTDAWISVYSRTCIYWGVTAKPRHEIFSFMMSPLAMSFGWILVNEWVGVVRFTNVLRMTDGWMQSRVQFWYVQVNYKLRDWPPM